MIDFIPGIHNYCDRWCERCELSHRCEVYFEEVRREQELGPLHHREDVASQLESVFANIFDTLKKSAEKAGVDLNALPPVDSGGPLPATPEEEELVGWCKEYSLVLQEFMDSPEFGFMQSDVGSSIDFDVLEGKMTAFIDAASVVRYYQHFIYIKCARAIKRFEWTDREDVQADCVGTAKVVLLACGESRNAWEELMEILDAEDTILDILALLDKIVRRVEELFPNAYDFVRPGFDEIGNGQDI